MERVAIPVFEQRVSPVLDLCHQMVIIDLDEGKEVQRHKLSLQMLSLSERCELISRWRVGKIICAGVSNLMVKLLAGKNIMLIDGKAGELDKIIEAYICNRLDDSCFIMPGKQ